MNVAAPERDIVREALRVVDAAQKLKAELDAGRTLAELCGRTFFGEFIYDKTSKLGAPVENPITHLSFGYATQLAILDRLLALLWKLTRGNFDPAPEKSSTGSCRHSKNESWNWSPAKRSSRFLWSSPMSTRTLCAPCK